VAVRLKCIKSVLCPRPGWVGDNGEGIPSRHSPPHVTCWCLILGSTSTRPLVPPLLMDDRIGQMDMMSLVVPFRLLFIHP